MNYLEAMHAVAKTVGVRRRAWTPATYLVHKSMWMCLGGTVEFQYVRRRYVVAVQIQGSKAARRCVIQPWYADSPDSEACDWETCPIDTGMLETTSRFTTQYTHAVGRVPLPHLEGHTPLPHLEGRATHEPAGQCCAPSRWSSYLRTVARWFRQVGMRPRP